MESSRPYGDKPTLLYPLDHRILPRYDMAHTMWPETNEAMFEVEILRDNTEDAELKKDIDEILNSNKYLCHICNTNVPKSYAKEHNDSKKHKNCNEIANIALERTRNQMQLEIFASRKIEVSDTYFCVPCSLVVLNSNKNTHEATEVHAISVQYDKILEGFIKIYNDFDQMKTNIKESRIGKLNLLKEKFEEESLADVDSIYTDEEYDDQNNDESKPDVEEYLKTCFTDFVKNELDIETFKSNLLKAFKNEYEMPAIELLSKAKKVVLKSKDMLEKIKQKALLFDKKLQECEKAALDYKVKIAESQFNKKTVSENKTGKNMLKTKARMLKKLQKAKMNDQANKDSSNITEESKNFEQNGVKIPDQCNSLVIAKGELKEKTPITDHVDMMKKNIQTNIVDVLDEATEELNKYENELTEGSISRIESILTKHFHKNCTIEALKNNATKNKTKSELNESSKNNTQKIKCNEQISEKAVEINNNTDLNSNFIGNNTMHKHKSKQQDDEIKCTELIDVSTKQQLTENEPNNIPSQKSLNENANKTKQRDDQKKTAKPNTDKKITKQNNNPKTSETLTKKEEKAPQAEDTKSLKNPAFNTKCYLKDLTRKCDIKPIHTIEAVTANIVQITAINGDKFKILINNFHSFHMKKGDMYCKVCQCPNIRRPEWHIVESEHRAKIMIPIEDSNGIRQLDDIWSHCVLCNDLTNNVKFHLNSLLHKNKVQQALVSLGKDSFSEVKDVNTKKCRPEDASLHNLISSNHLALTNKNYLNCTICDVIVTHELTCVRQHVNSFEHLNNLEVKVVENYIFNIEALKYYCIPCDAHVEKVVLVNHINGKKHSSMLDEYLVRIGQKTSEEQEKIIALTSISQNVKKLPNDKDKIFDTELICFVCNTVILSEEDHMNTFDHKTSYLKYLETNKLNEVEPELFYCIPCDIVVTIEYLMCHCMGKTHKRKLTYMKNNIGYHLEDPNSKETPETTVQNDANMTKNTASNLMSSFGMLDQGNNMSKTSAMSNFDMTGPGMSNTPVSNDMSKQEPTVMSNPKMSQSDMPIKVLYQFKQLTSSNNLLCIICDDEVQYSRKQTSYHISTLNHTVAFNLTMLWNKIKKRDDKYFCDICREDLTYFSEIEHVLSEAHVRNLGLQPKGTVYEYDRTLLTHSYAISHKVGDRLKPTPILALKNDK